MFSTNVFTFSPLKRCLNGSSNAKYGIQFKSYCVLGCCCVSLCVYISHKYWRSKCMTHKNNTVASVLTFVWSLGSSQCMLVILEPLLNYTNVISIYSTFLQIVSYTLTIALFELASIKRETVWSNCDLLAMFAAVILRHRDPHVTMLGNHACMHSQ